MEGRKVKGYFDLAVCHRSNLGGITLGLREVDLGWMTRRPWWNDFLNVNRDVASRKCADYSLLDLVFYAIVPA